MFQPERATVKKRAKQRLNFSVVSIVAVDACSVPATVVLPRVAPLAARFGPAEAMFRVGSLFVVAAIPFPVVGADDFGAACQIRFEIRGGKSAAQSHLRSSAGRSGPIGERARSQSSPPLDVLVALKRPRP